MNLKMFYGPIFLVDSRDCVLIEIYKWKPDKVLHMCSRLLADLNSQLYVPEAVNLDRKHILEDIESKYREFITATLRCLSELKRELCECPLGDTWSPNSSNCLKGPVCGILVCLLERKKNSKQLSIMQSRLHKPYACFTEALTNE